MPLGLDQGVGAVVWSPLGWGRLTGKIPARAKPPKVSRLHKTAAMGPQLDDDHLFKVVDALEAVAAETGKTVPQVAFNWLLRRPTCLERDHRRAQRRAAAPEHRRRRLEPHAGAGRAASTRPAPRQNPIPIGIRASSRNAIPDRCDWKPHADDNAGRTFREPRLHGRARTSN